MNLNEKERKKKIDEVLKSQNILNKLWIKLWASYPDGIF